MIIPCFTCFGDQHPVEDALASALRTKVGELFSLLWDWTLGWPTNLILLQGNKDEIQREANELSALKEDVMAMVDNEAAQPGRERTHQVEGWLEEERSLRERLGAFWNSFEGKSICVRARDAAELLRVVRAVKARGARFNVGARVGEAPPDARVLVKEMEDLGAMRNDILRKVMAQEANPEVRRTYQVQLWLKRVDAVLRTQLPAKFGSSTNDRSELHRVLGDVRHLTKQKKGVEEELATPQALPKGLGQKFKRMRKHWEEHAGVDKSVDEPTRYKCDMCGMPGFGQRQSCPLCGMTYHLYCDTCPYNPPCFLHPGQHYMNSWTTSPGGYQCTICDKETVGLAFHCELSEQQVHPICYLLRRRPDADPGLGKTINHFSHPDHSLTEIYFCSAYCCKGCGTRGFGLRFRCERCDFDLHHYCATCPQTMPCFLHPGHEMARLVVESGSFECYMCGDPIRRANESFLGLHYGCETSHAHPLCIQLALERHHNTAGGSSNGGVCRRI